MRKGRRGGAKTRSGRKKIQVGSDIFISSNDKLSYENIDGELSAAILDYIENVRENNEIDNMKFLKSLSFEDPELSLSLKSDASSSSESGDFHKIGFDYECTTNLDEVKEQSQTVTSEEAALNSEFDSLVPSIQKRDIQARSKAKQEAYKPSRGTKQEHHKSVDFKGIDRENINSIDGSSLMSCPLPIAPKMASSYNIHSQVVGSESERSHITPKTRSTPIPKQRERVDKFVQRAESWLNLPTSKGNSRKTGMKKSSRQPIKIKLEPVLAPAHGTVVGAEAKPLPESNIGHQLLSKMGYILLLERSLQVNC
ncbi:squalene synthetase-like protein [Basidiobolus ranarum]|uniref:Squalene synthetase-like protein n=1 Tax=Basidiobolus ranarum TaxID=34480 RepID=A0ABR2WN69_9FUNG